MQYSSDNLETFPVWRYNKFCCCLWSCIRVCRLQLGAFSTAFLQAVNQSIIPLISILTKHINTCTLILDIRKLKVSFISTALAVQITTTHTTTVLRPFFRDHPGEPVPEENFWTAWCKGRLTEADTLTIRLGATPSGLTSAHLHHLPIFFTGRIPFPPSNQHQCFFWNKWCRYTCLILALRLHALKVICTDFLVVKVNCWSHVFNTIQPIWILRNTKR